jgi:Flp pilus assembly protein TadB
MLYTDSDRAVLVAIALGLYLLGVFWVRRLVNPAR